MGDSIHLRQVLTEFMGNALKFTSRGEIIVRVIEAEQNDQQLWLTFKVTDTGIGIAEEDLTRLFRPFVQVDSGLTRRHGGTGLGLYISRRLATLLGGHIEVNSKQGVGSTFSVVLPLVREGRG